jgi:site-specific DNA-methyltransferase (adenine-specific)
MMQKGASPFVGFDSQTLHTIGFRKTAIPFTPLFYFPLTENKTLTGMPLSEVKNIDCMEGMKQYPDKFFELAIVDPPYGIGASNFGSYGIVKKRFTTYKKKDWDNSPPNIDYFLELIRVSKNQIIWGGNYFLWALTPCTKWIIWDKIIPDGCDFGEYELAWTSDFAKGKIFRLTGSWNNGGNTKDLSRLQKPRRIHPTQKPVALYKWLLKNYAKPGDKILDTHLGSGSSRIAAYDMGFDFTAFEIDKDYFEAQEKRFQDHIKQLSLFVPSSNNDLNTPNQLSLI